MGTRYNWDDVWWMGPVIVGFGAALALLLVLEWPKQALLHRGPLARPEFAFACLTSLVSGYGLTATAMLAPLYVRRLFGFAAQDAGVLQLPSVVPIGLALGVSVVATQRNWLSATQLIVLGMAMFLASLGLWSQATSQVDMGFVATVVALRGGALGLMAVPTARLAFARLDDLHAVYAAGYYQSARQWGGALATLTVTWRLAETQSRFHYQIAQHMTVSDPAITQWVAQRAQAIGVRGTDPFAQPALGTALATKALADQVLVLAYNACFLEIMLVYGVLMSLALGYRALSPAPSST
jgi:DHA2 family multidrug resistance protein